jgi:thermitase
MKASKPLTLFILFCGLGLSACGESNRGAGSYLSTDGKVEIAAVSLKDDEAGKTWIKKGAHLVGVVDRLCAQNQPAALTQSLRILADDLPLQRQAYAFTAEQDIDIEEFSKQAQADPCLEYVADDIEVSAVAQPNDPKFSSQWSMKAINAAPAFDVFYGSSGIKSSVIIAVIDSGVNYAHPDLQANMWKSPQGSYGYDFFNRDGDPKDDNGHGTHVAGIIGAVRNNGLGISGVMGSKVKIMAVKTLGASGSGSTTEIINGMNYAIENGAQVINLSLGSRGENAGLKRALQNAVSHGVIVLAAAGNDGERMTATNFFSPGSYGRDISGVISVGSFDSRGQRSSFSNYGYDYVEISAPGSGIYSTYLNSYRSLSGTSMATPAVAGAAGLAIGLLRSRGISTSPATLERLLKQSSAKSSGLSGTFESGNMLSLSGLAALIQSL